MRNLERHHHQEDLLEDHVWFEDRWMVASIV
jgi:hypothetical protein